MKLRTLARKGLDAVEREIGLAPEMRAARRLGPVPAGGDGPRVLFLTPRSWAAHVQWDAMVGRALAARGATVSYLTCGGGRTVCDRVHVYEGPPMPCRSCTGYTHAALDAHGHHWEPLHGTGSSEPAWPELDGMSLGELEQVSWRGLPLGELVGIPARWYLCNTNLGDDPLAPITVRRFLRSAAAIADEIDAALGRHRPDIVVMLNGLFLFEQIGRELCTRAGIDVVTYERGYVSGTVFFHRGDTASRYDTSALWPQFRDRALTPEEDTQLDAYLAGRRTGQGMVNSFWPAPRFDAPDPGFAVMFTNVMWDTAVQARDRCFDSPHEWILETVRWFIERPERRLVVRVHPAEIRLANAQSREGVADLISRAQPSLPANIRIVPPDDPTSSYPLMEAADVALVYTSTAGLEAVINGTPCIAAGATQFGNKGFTVDPPDRTSYFVALDSLLADPVLPPAEVELARRYAHFFFFKAAVRTDRWAWEPLSGLARITDDRSVVTPGGDRGLDVIADGILERRPFVSDQ